MRHSRLPSRKSIQPFDMDPRVKPEGDGFEGEEISELRGLRMVNRTIPAAIRREVEQEAGYRCAIPTCRDKGPFDFEHIDEWSKVQKHEFHNIILLCVSCHARVTRKNTTAAPISKDALRRYKRNLATVSGRYSLFEMRMLEGYFELKMQRVSKDDSIAYETEVVTDVGAFIGNNAIHFASEIDLLHMKGLLRDDFIEAHSLNNDSNLPTENGVVSIGRFKGIDAKLLADMQSLMSNKARYIIFPTKSGLDFMRNYFEGNEIE